MEIKILEIINEYIKGLTPTKTMVAPLLLQLLCYKNETTIHSDKLMKLRWFFDKTGKDNWIEEIKTYRVGKYSKTYRKGEKLLELQDLILKSLKFNDLEEKIPCKDDIIIHKDHLKDVNISALMKAGRYYDQIVVPNESKQQIDISGRPIGRKYSSFSSSKDLRSISDTPVEIDISCAVQTVLINTYSLKTGIPMEQVLDKFPLYKLLLQDKKLFRSTMASKLGLSIEEVKTEITKITFGGRTRIKKQAILDFQAESAILRQFITEQIKSSKGPEREHIEKNATRKKLQDRAKKTKSSSKLFFWYEIQEQKIRDCMTSYIQARGLKVQEVHDAVYTSEQIDLGKLSLYIKDITGYDIKF